MNVAKLLTYSPNRFRRELGDIPSAVLSADEEQRYLLTRRTRGGNDLLVNFIMLNPSTADAESDDQTIRRCKGFAQSWGFEYMAVTNLWSYRTRPCCSTPSHFRRRWTPGTQQSLSWWPALPIRRL